MGHPIPLLVLWNAFEHVQYCPIEPLTLSIPFWVIRGCVWPTSMLQGILPREYPVTLRMCAHTITRNHSLLYNRNHWNVLTKELQHIWLQTADWSIWHIRYLKSYRVFSGGLVSSLRMPCSIEVGIKPTMKKLVKLLTNRNVEHQRFYFNQFHLIIIFSD